MKPTETTASSANKTRGAVVPIWLFVLLFMLLYWGALYFDAKGGWFSAKVYAPFHTEEEVASLQPGGGGNEFFDLGKQVYNRPTCSACHMPSGQGSPGQFPPLTGSEWVLEEHPGRFIRLVLYGLQGPITVKGQQFNSSMVPWNMLSDEEVAAVITYVRQNKEWGNNASAVTPEQVKAVREKVGNRAQPFTAAELLQIDPTE
ncbi:MAG TPA: cytochrome c [Verrucomicrobiae bacterium]|nr:cytochrome c [Verrucomicrobiae bacterium]